MTLYRLGEDLNLCIAGGGAFDAAPPNEKGFREMHVLQGQLIEKNWTDNFNSLALEV